jgi:hypothetical protein
MLMIELMSKYFAIERPAKRVGHHADKQQKHDRMDMAALVHALGLYTPMIGTANICFSWHYRKRGAAWLAGL